MHNALRLCLIIAKIDVMCQTASQATGLAPDVPIEHFGIEPDLIPVAKSLAARSWIVPGVGSLGGTYGGNPLACAAALAVIEVHQEPAFQERAPILGEKN